MRTTTSAPPTRRVAAKITGSVGVVAAAAAVAGLSTFGTFTDSTTPVQTRVDTGVVSIALTDAARQAAVPVVAGGWVPGDRHQVAVDLANDGTVPLSSLTLTSRATASSLLDTDGTHGLQLTLESCSAPWDVAGSSYTCAGDRAAVYAGPVVTERAMPSARSLAPGRVDHLLVTVGLPQTADNRFQNASSALEFVFTGVQRDGADR